MGGGGGAVYSIKKCQKKDAFVCRSRLNAVETLQQFITEAFKSYFASFTRSNFSLDGIPGYSSKLSEAQVSACAALLKEIEKGNDVHSFFLAASN
jgi:hypothetical protein